MKYNTPKELWENLKEFLPKKDVVVLGSLLWETVTLELY
jgi:hypothetical protein